MHRLQSEEREEAVEVKIGYIGGGSQKWAETIINDLVQCEGICGEVALYDVRYKSAERNANLGNHVVRNNNAARNWTFKAYHDRAEALSGADFVICSIQDPPAETFVHDIDIPKEYGVYQTVGDTVGPGGVFRSLRAIPQYRDIAATVREQCPSAWVINYSNPMTICTRALYKEYPDINAIGLCHEVFKTQSLFADMVEKYIDGENDVDPEEININVKGVNHFTWVDEAYWRNYDVFQYLEQELKKRKPIPEFNPGDLKGESTRINHLNVAFDLYDQFGVLGAAGDRHLVEFVPWYLDIDNPDEIHRWGIRLTPSSTRLRDKERKSATERYLDGEEEFKFYDSGEEAVDIIRALLGIQPIKTNLNYPNYGQMSDIRPDAVVETNVIVSGDDVSPINAGKLPRPVRNMVNTIVENQETLIEAGFKGDLDIAFQAFLNEPLMTVQRDTAQEMFRDLVEEESDYLTDYNLDAADIIREECQG